jgi:bifunctional DNA-binding transcriptional regulator/antitoxin component of YhaV-PrlF toxin-antitoxin module
VVDIPGRVRLTRRHAITLPDAVRRALFLRAGDLVEFHVEPGRVWLARATDRDGRVAVDPARRVPAAPDDLPGDVSAWAPPGQKAAHDPARDPWPRR